ncbi:MAG TPA: hypothetical protein VF052_04360 [Solirubrobacterales bacterium]
MYQTSRSIYRDLAPRIDASGGAERTLAARQRLLEARESTVQRLVTDRRYFARPAKTLFTEVREYFVLAEQVRVYMVIERHIELIQEFLDSLPADVGRGDTGDRCGCARPGGGAHRSRLM